MSICVRIKYKISHKVLIFRYFYLEIFVRRITRGIILGIIKNEVDLEISETLPPTGKLLVAYYIPLNAIPHQQIYYLMSLKIMEIF